MERRTVVVFARLLVCVGLCLQGQPMAARGALPPWLRAARQHHPPPPKTPRQNATNPPPREVTKSFKDLSVNTKFFIATDKNEAFPKMKVSATGARDLSTDGKLGGLDDPVPPDTLVIVKNVAANPPKPKKHANTSTH